MKRTTTIFLFATALVAAMAANASATIVYQTNFNSPTYSDGAIIGQDGWVITGTSTTNPINVANTATDGNVTLTTTGQDVNRPYTPVATSDKVLLSADINVATAGTGDYFLHVSDGSSSLFYDRVFVKSSGAGFVMALGTSSGATPTYGSTVLNFGQTYHIVAEYDFVTGSTTNDTGALYVNPTDPINGGDNLYVAATTQGTDATTISAVNLRQGTTGSAPGVTVDNIAVAVQTVPEPSSLVLAGIACLGCLGAFRRRLG